MSQRFIRIYPNKSLNSNSPYLNIFILSGGYLEAEEREYWNDCQGLIKKLQKFTPFNLTKAQPTDLGIYAMFSPSPYPGPAIFSSLTKEEVLFGISIYPERELFDFNKIELEQFFNKKLNQHYTSRIIEYDSPESLRFQTLLVVLVPSRAQFPDGGEGFFSLGENKIPCILTSVDFEWPQVIIRALGKLFNLGDEFEQESNRYLEPDKNPDEFWEGFSYPNLINLENSGEILDFKDIKWNNLIPKDKQVVPIEIINAKSHPQKPDYSIPEFNFSPEQIQFWMGGGSYRTKVLRSSHDCLMRRRIGDKRLPVRKEKVPLCKVCERHFRYMILKDPDFNLGIFEY